MRQLRRLVPQRCGDGVHAARHFRHDRGRSARAVLESNTMWQCVSCYFCTARCPQEIPITEIMYTLKRMSIREGKAGKTDAPALAKTFTDFVDKYGRSFEFGIATAICCSTSR
jgi:heterodisulfide reductase subunit C